MQLAFKIYMIFSMVCFTGCVPVVVVVYHVYRALLKVKLVALTHFLSSQPEEG